MRSIRYKLVDASHPVCADTGDHWLLDQLPANAKLHIKKWDCLASPSMAVIAMDGKELVGFYRFDIDMETLVSLGTWVASSYRRQGMASKMWKKAMEEYPGFTVEVYPTSDDGRSFVKHMTERYPDRVTRV